MTMSEATPTGRRVETPCRCWMCSVGRTHVGHPTREREPHHKSCDCARCTIARESTKPISYYVDSSLQGTVFACENVNKGIIPAPYVPKHLVYAWRGPTPWDPEDLG